MNTIPNTSRKAAFPPCRDRIARLLEGQGYECLEYYVSRGQQCWVYQRDPWEAQVIIAVGDRNDKFADYCQTGNTEAVA